MRLSPLADHLNRRVVPARFPVLRAPPPHALWEEPLRRVGHPCRTACALERGSPGRTWKLHPALTLPCQTLPRDPGPGIAG